jgi:hypothetical protein
MRRMECKDCNCCKSEHHTDICMSCYAIYCDNYKEYMKTFVEENRKFVSPWHKFKLDNLKWLEQCAEAKGI